MDDVARLRARDRADLFGAVAAKRGLSTAIIEKDFWVCWTLKRLFGLPTPPAELIFKGGTSLSKVFKAIERFSEDVDLSFNRAGLGFEGDKDPLNAASRKKKQEGVKELAGACREAIRERFLPQLREAIATALGTPEGEVWQIDFDPDDPDQQTLAFRYPSNAGGAASGRIDYVRPVVRLEIGARSDHWPAEDATVAPYAAEDFPHLFKVATCRVRVLSAERTFWEKATILHMWYHAPAEKTFRDRQSRHYYDIVRLHENGVGDAAIAEIDLLAKVADHKSVFFASGWAKYEEARPGTLRLVPPPARVSELEKDYEKMREMIFGEPPGFDHILRTLKGIEDRINGGAS
jgi:hypothetical protein